jgi:transcriptional regulator with XRE-family HTH domain
MPARPQPLVAHEPKKRLPVPDGLWYFPRNLADYGNAKGLSQEELAAMVGVAQSTISRWLHYGIESLQVRHVMMLEDGMGLEHGTLTKPPAAFLQAANRS